MSVGLYIGRKGIVDFVELAKRLPQYHFIWFGYNPLWQVPHKIRKAVRTRLPNLHFPGYIGSEELRCAYWGSDLFLSPPMKRPRASCFWRRLHPAAPRSFGDIPIYRNWLTDRVNVYKANSVDTFEKAIQEILENRCPPVANAAFEVAQSRSLEIVGKQLKNVYERCLRGDFTHG